jgi:hypothetical protein
MDLPNPKELKALLKVCRDYGVSDVSFGSISVKFGELPKDAPAEHGATGTVTPTEEELLYWSSHDPMLDIAGAQ